jgi:tRNA (mo5U34)-methyltransferase
VGTIRKWHHSIDLGGGVVTPGRKSPAQLTEEASYLPDVRGKSVLDIGAWDGYFSFECEKRGAAQVVSLDHYVWGLRMDGRERESLYEQMGRGAALTPLDESEFFDPVGQPGKRGYDLAHEALGSRAQSVFCDYMKYQGRFDVVLYLGVLYHMRDPYGSLLKVAELTREMAFIETAATVFPGLEHVPLCEFYGKDELNDDPTNWWAPNLKALEDMCLSAGFRRLEVKVGPRHDPLTPRARAGAALRAAGLRPALPLSRYRAFVYAWK